MTQRSSPSSGPEALQRAVRAELRRRADPDRAEAIRRYMKSAMPYYGVATPALRATCRDLFQRHPLDSAAAWRDAVLALWRGARRREERYAAIELLGWRAYAQHRTLDTLPLLEEMIVDGAWWDYVDAIATHRLRELLERHPRPMTKTMRAWSRSSDLWKRRSAILCQVGRKQATDTTLLFACIEPNLAHREFFVRKAIGWALRDYAWTDLATVERWVDQQGDRLSPLSRREALKNRAALSSRS